MSYHDLSAFHLPDLERMIAGVRRLRGEAGTQERLPITKDLLLQMLPHLSQRTREGATLYASFCLAFAAFLRIGEFTYSLKDRTADFSKWFLTRRSMRLFDNHLELTLPASKTDPFRRGVTLTIAASGDDACPVEAIRYLFRRWKAPLDSPLFETAGGFTRELVIGQVRQNLALLGIKGHYSGHSFRRGAATSARAAGLSDDEIMLLGRWKSDAYRLYIDTHPERLLAASRRHQRLSPHR